MNRCTSKEFSIIVLIILPYNSWVILSSSFTHRFPSHMTLIEYTLQRLAVHLGRYKTTQVVSLLGGERTDVRLRRLLFVAEDNAEDFNVLMS